MNIKCLQTKFTFHPESFPLPALWLAFPLTVNSSSVFSLKRFLQIAIWTFKFFPDYPPILMPFPQSPWIVSPYFLNTTTPQGSASWLLFYIYNYKMSSVSHMPLSLCYLSLYCYIFQIYISSQTLLWVPSRLICPITSYIFPTLANFLNRNSMWPDLNYCSPSLNLLFAQFPLSQIIKTLSASKNLSNMLNSNCVIVYIKHVKLVVCRSHIFAAQPI